MAIQPSEYLEKCLKVKLHKEAADMVNTDAAIVTMEKGRHPIRMGEEVTDFYFIVYGIVRGYYIDEDGNDMTKCFACENHFFGSECFRTNKESTFFVECLEECKCIRLPYQLVKELLLADPQVAGCIQNLYLDEGGKLEDRAKKLLLLSAEERYILFCREYPSLQKRLPLKYIASYIGIKPGSMSRIRKKLKTRL